MSRTTFVLLSLLGSGVLLGAGDRYGWEFISEPPTTPSLTTCVGCTEIGDRQERSGALNTTETPDIADSLDEADSGNMTVPIGEEAAEQEGGCVRTKPYWLGTVQGFFSLVRLGILTGCGHCGGTVVLLGAFLNSLLEVVELGAIAIDYFVQKNFWLDVLLGDNSMLEGVEIFVALFHLQNHFKKERLQNTARGMFAGLLQIVYGVRIVLWVAAAGLTVAGNVAYPVVLALFVLLAVFRLLLCCCTQRVKDFANDAYSKLFRVQNLTLGGMDCCMSSFGLVLVAGVLQLFEMLGIAGWNLILKRGPGDRNNHRDYLLLVYRCGNLHTWVANRIDFYVMLASIA